MSKLEDKSWGHMQLRLRKEELLKEINAYIKDQHDGAKHTVIAHYLGVSHGSVGRILANDTKAVSLDLLYRIACELELGTTVYTPQYGNFGG